MATTRRRGSSVARNHARHRPLAKWGNKETPAMPMIEVHDGTML
jgi:hypothetical protein